MINLKLYETLQPDDTRRFYPSYCPILEYEPLTDNFALLKSPEEIGNMIVSKVSFQEGDLIANLSGFIVSYQTLYTLQMEEGQYISDTFFSGYLTHSCEPNAELKFNPYSIYALKKIIPGTLLTIDYEKTEDYLAQEFTCKCGSTNCRKYIMGKKASEQYEQEELDKQKELKKMKGKSI